MTGNFDGKLRFVGFLVIHMVNELTAQAVKTTPDINKGHSTHTHTHTHTHTQPKEKKMRAP